MPRWLRLPRFKPSPLARIALGLGLAVLTLMLLAQGLVAVAVDQFTADYVKRFMRGTVDVLVNELRPLDHKAREARIRQLDQTFAYPVSLVRMQDLSGARQEQLLRGELVVAGLNRRVYARLDPKGDAVLQLGPLNADWQPGESWQLPRELWLQLLTGLALSIAVMGLAWWLLRPAWRDLRELQAAADQISAGHFDTPLPRPRSRLFAPLAHAIRSTLQRLASALASQRELTGAVSHELRTPLARLRFAIDALIDEDDAARREAQVQACERDIEELEGLIDASLMLARLDTGALSAKPEPGDLTELLVQESESLRPLLDGKDLSLLLKLPDAALPFDAQILPYALRNGLRNAARHARSRICLQAWLDQGQIWLAIDDDGEGVPEALRELVFTPFKRLERHRRSRGFGLGLAIVRHVAESHGGEALMQRAPELGGARLLIRWPQQLPPGR